MEKDEIIDRMEAIKDVLRAKQKEVRAVKGIPEDETKIPKRASIRLHKSKQ